MASFELSQYVNNLISKIEREGITVERIRALYSASATAMFQEEDVDYSLKVSDTAKKYIAKYCLTESHRDFWNIENYCVDNKKHIDIVDLYYDILKQESYYNFQSFIYYMEKNRGSKKRFYFPRRRTLQVVVKDLMDLENRKFKFYGLSMPSRVGKSTICIFFLAWILMKRPNSHNAMGGHSGALAKGFYKEILNLITDAEYSFGELYEFWHPNEVLVRDKSAEDFSIVLGDADRFASIVCRGQDATWTGAIDISVDGYLYVDDLVKNREMSLSPQRMEDCFQTYLNTMVDRKNDGARELMVGTLWNVTDPLERIRVQNQDNPEYRFRRIPALNDNDESNFKYDFNGFSSEYYKEVRERLDRPEWEAKYQQRPFVREGLLFEVDALRYFDGLLPDKEHKTVAVIDPAFGGGDSLSMPVCADYGGDEKYIIDWIFNRGTQKTTVRLVVNAIIRYGITEVRIEKNNGGQLYAESVKKALDEKNCWHCRVTLASAPVHLCKEDKISGYSDSIKDKFIFLLPKKSVKKDTAIRLIRSQEYQNAMDELCMYSAQGKNPHDDAPDSLAQLSAYFERTAGASVTVIKNPFRYY